MEDYRNSHSRPVHRKTLSSAAAQQPAVFIIGDNAEGIDRCVRKFRALNWRTAFNDPDINHGRKLAQLTGAQHHPISARPEMVIRSIELIRQRWSDLDMVVIATSPEKQPALMDLLDREEIFYLLEPSIPLTENS